MKATLFASVLFLLTTLIANSAIYVVKVKNFAYEPSTVNMFLGDTLRFVWESGIHPTASMDGEWPTFTISSSHPQHDVKMNRLGTFQYQCDSHISGGMSGTITVDPLLGAASAIPSRLKIYPNPAKEKVTVELEGVNANEIQINTLCGHLVYKEVLSEQETAITTDLPAGKYLISVIRNGEIIETRKLVVGR